MAIFWSCRWWCRFRLNCHLSAVLRCSRLEFWQVTPKIDALKYPLYVEARSPLSFAAIPSPSSTCTCWWRAPCSLSYPPIAHCRLPEDPSFSRASWYRCPIWSFLHWDLQWVSVLFKVWLSIQWSYFSTPPAASLTLHTFWSKGQFWHWWLRAIFSFSSNTLAFPPPVSSKFTALFLKAQF